MADETIRRLFDKIDDLTKHLTRLEAIMMESVIKKTGQHRRTLEQS